MTNDAKQRVQRYLSIIPTQACIQWVRKDYSPLFDSARGSRLEQNEQFARCKPRAEGFDF
jgi:hypothetical protein